MITVESYKDLKALRFHGDGETAYVKKDKKGYVYREAENKWIPINTDGSGLTMNLYEINKSVYSQMEPLSDESLDYLKRDIDKGFTGKYYLLYGKEISYFTLFEKQEDSEETLGEAVLSCLKPFGKIYSYEFRDEEEVVEIWVHNEENSLATVLHLFNYENGVVYYE